MRSLTLLLLALSLPTWAAEPTTPDVVAPVRVDGPAAPAIEVASITPEQVLEQLPKSAAITLQDGKLWWDDGKGARIGLAVVACGQGNPSLDTAIGNLAIERKLLADGRTDIIPRLAPLIATAQAAGIKAEGFTVKEGILTGVHLRADRQLVLPEGVVSKVEAPPLKRSAEREALEAAVQGAVAGLASTKLDDLGRKCVEDVLNRLDNEDGKQDVDEVAPSFARRMVRFGYLGQFFGNDAKATALIEAINRANVFAPTTAFRGTTADGKPLLLAEVKNAFESSGWILQTPQRVSYTRQLPAPLYDSAMETMNVVVDLPPGSDPTTFPDASTTPLAARLYRTGQQVAAWSKDSGFTFDKELWRAAVPNDKRQSGIDKNIAKDFMPPHILIAGFDGDIAGLATAGGWLAAPSGTPSDGERFLREAAAQLPDAAHLDLIGEWILSYCYDSPDSRFPLLVGNKQIKGDIHQTALQTLSTATGGVIRGDCDDLAELYQNICEKQGRTAIVLALPSHAANAWAEKQDDDQWHVFVLQTGPALEFVAADLPKALEQAYKSFGASEVFDANGLGLLLRFSGENTRSSWRLSWRIFAEPDYAKTMIDVQKDWHFQTYQRGIKTMQEMIAKGDTDTANYRELSGLYSFTGQYLEAADFQAKAIAATREPESRFFMQLEQLGHLFAAGRTNPASIEQAVALGKELIEVQFPQLKAKLGPATWSAGMDLVMILNRSESSALATKAIETMLLEPLNEQSGSLNDKIALLAGYVQSPKYNQQVWDGSGQMLEMRKLTSQYAGTCIALLADAGPARLAQEETLQTAAKSAELWLTTLAFHDVDEPGEAPMRYASAARYYAAILGQERFDQLLAAAVLPTDGDHDHAQRIGGLAQLPLDLPWIRISVPYWLGRMQELFNQDHKTLDKAELLRLNKNLEEAYAVSSKLGIEHPQIEFAHHLGSLLAALVGQDKEALKARLDYVKEKGDKRLRDDTAQWLGDASRFLSIEWFGTVMQVWKAELNYKPKYFWIAWRAGLSGAPQHALLAAKMAADLFGIDPVKEDYDPAFKEEYDFMSRLYEPPATNPPVIKPPVTKPPVTKPPVTKPSETKE